MRAERRDGGFRVLWLGDPLVLPLDPAVGERGLGYVLTRNGPGDGRELWRAPERGADRALGDALGLALDGRTNRLGHLLAPMGVRYLVVPDRRGPGADDRVDPPRGLRASLADQTDLVPLGTEPGLVLYENAGWAATRATVGTGDGANARVDADDPVRAALLAELAGADPVTGPLRQSAPTGPGTLLWAEAYDPEWEASGVGGDLEHVKAFGISNGYVVSERGRVALHYRGQLPRSLAIAGQAALWVVVAVAWWLLRGGRRPGHAARGEDRS
jgi:hypothetical protein